MILYYSGTGNTRHVAHSLAKLLDDEVLFLPHVNPRELKIPGNWLLFCFPVYAWGVPPLVIEFINRFSGEFKENTHETSLPILAVATCGDETAMAPEMLDRALSEQGLELKGFWSVTMPNDYVLLPGFDVDGDEVAKGKIRDSANRIKEIASSISQGSWRNDFVRGSWPRLKTALVYPLFRKFARRLTGWKVSESCIGCGKCASSCPVGNISMVGGKPEWGPACESCTACYHVCPVNAVSYGSVTKGKGQYYFGNSSRSDSAIKI